MSFKKKEKEGLSIANIVSVIGIVGFGILWGLSLAYITFSMTAAILGGLGAAAVAALLLILAVKFRQKESADTKWRISEYVCASLLFIILLGSIFPFSHFTGIQSGRKELQRIGEEDVENIKGGLNSFLEAEKQYLQATVGGLENIYSSHGSTSSMEVKEFMEKNRITSKESIELYKDDRENDIMDVRVKAPGSPAPTAMNKGWRTTLEKAGSYINSWNAFRLPIGIADLERVNKEVAEYLPLLASSLDFPTIVRRNSTYVIEDNHPVPPPYSVTLNLEKAIENVGYFNIYGLITGLCTLLLTGFNYFTAPRSRRLRMSRAKNDALGRIL